MVRWLFCKSKEWDRAHGRGDGSTRGGAVCVGWGVPGAVEQAMGRGMKVKRERGTATFGLMFCLASHAFAQELPSLARGEDGTVRFVIVDKDGAAVFGSAGARTPDPGNGAAFLGLLFRAGGEGRSGSSLQCVAHGASWMKWAG